MCKYWKIFLYLSHCRYIYIQVGNVLANIGKYFLFSAANINLWEENRHSLLLWLEHIVFSSQLLCYKYFPAFVFRISILSKTCRRMLLLFSLAGVNISPHAHFSFLTHKLNIRKFKMFPGDWTYHWNIIENMKISLK